MNGGTDKSEGGALEAIETCRLIERLRKFPEAEEIFWRLHHFNHRSRERTQSHYAYCQKPGRRFAAGSTNAQIQLRLVAFLERAQEASGEGGRKPDFLRMAEAIYEEMPALHAKPPLWTTSLDRKSPASHSSPLHATKVSAMSPAAAGTPIDFLGTGSLPNAVESVFRRAIECRECFKDNSLRPALVDIAQPRFIGPGYWGASVRILLVGLNPGSGDGRTDDADLVLRDLLRAYKERQADINPIFRHQHADLRNWGRFEAHFVQGLGIDLNRTALVNLAWCADAENAHPPAMTERCWTRHTGALLSLLDPHVILLCGRQAQRYRAQVAAVCPAARIENSLHHAHRLGHSATDKDIARLRLILQGARSSSQ